MTRFVLEVNGHERTVEGDEAMPLLWALRDALGLRGTKFGCGAGFCGACTVLIGDAPVRSCVTTLGRVTGPITTIEGLGGEHPVQRAWIAEQVPQCGYCQSGQILAAVALLRRAPRPTEDEVRSAMSGNLCRCGTYPRIARAIRRVVEGHDG